MKLRTLLLSAVLICAGMTAQAQLKITFNPVKGQTYSYRFNTDQINKMMMGQDMTMKTVTDLLMEMTVRENNGKEITMDYAYKEIVLTSSNEWMGDIKFDSKNKNAGASEPEQLIAQIMKCLIGKTMQVVILPDGTVKSITGFNAIQDEMQKIMASNSMGQMGGMYLQMFDEAAMKNNFEQTFKMLPDKEIKAGDSWNNNLSFLTNGFMAIDIKNTFTLKSVSNDIALIDVVSTTNMKATENMEGELKGDQKGETRLNVKTGMPVQLTSLGTAKGQFSAQGMDFSSEITTKTTVTLQ